MTTVRVNTCIVGGGPAGLLLGLLLAKRGVDVLVLEGHETFDREFRGEVLQPSTARLLSELGLLEYILAEPQHSLLERGRIRVNGREVGQFSFAKIAPEFPYAIWMPQPVFLSALRRKAAECPSFECWMGARVSALVQENGCTVGVSGVRHGSEPFEVRADVVIGADGRHSMIAKLGGFRPEYEHGDFELVWFTIDQPADWPTTLYISLGQGASGLMLPKYPRQIQVGIAMKAGEWKQWKKQGVAAVADLVRRFDPICAPFADGVKDFTKFFPLDGSIRLMKDWAQDGLLLIGDAAHTMSPAGAIGVNVALATAAVAAQELYPRLGRGPIRRADLQRVQRLREDDVRALHRLQLRAQTVMLGRGNGNPVTNWIAPRAVRLLVRSPILPRVMRRVFFGVPLPPLDRAFSFS